jgi:polyphosphate kinase 2 (PPK2 family)
MLAAIDLSLDLSEEEYKKSIIQNQVALSRLAFQVYQQQRPVVMVFEGWDAAGKGGAIRRLTEGIDPRGFVVYPIAAPKGDDATHHYLWRFWRRLPESGQIAIFDRSWYGRVMVERIEGFCSEADWKRAYREINYFERQLVDFGTILFKFWLHIDKDEQLRRFESRAGDRLRSWKLTDEDWRNREKWELYEEAVNDMLLKTSTLSAPWSVIEGNSKFHARVKILKTVVDKLAKELKFDPFADSTFAAQKADGKPQSAGSKAEKDGKKGKKKPENSKK